MRKYGAHPWVSARLQDNKDKHEGILLEGKLNSEEEWQMLLAQVVAELAQSDAEIRTILCTAITHMPASTEEPYRQVSARTWEYALKYFFGVQCELWPEED